MTYGDLYNAIPLWIGLVAGAIGCGVLIVTLALRRMGKL